jgi:hypothetical protein
MFTVTRDDIIKAALQDLSVLEEGGTPSATTLSKASFSLNLILKSWQTEGLKLWTIDNLVVPLVAGQTKYTIGDDISNDVVSDKPLRIIQGLLRNTLVTPNIEIPMQAVSRTDYNLLGSKLSTGVMNTYFYNPKVDYGELYVYLTPDSFVEATYQFVAVIQRPILDVNLSTDTFDLPSEWFLALKWALQAELASSYDKSLSERQYLDMKASILKENVISWDIENASIYFVPDQRAGFK